MNVYVLAGVFLFISAFFSGSETALFSIPREKVSRYGNSQKRLYRYVFALLEEGQQTLLLILLGNLFVNVTVVGFMYTIINRWVGDGSTVITLFVATGTILVCGEIVPKIIALRFNETVVLGIALPLYYLWRVMRPALRWMQVLNSEFLKFFARLLLKPRPYVTIPEIKTRAASLVEEGVISSAEQELVARVLDIGDAPVKTVLHHRSQVTIVPWHTKVSDVIGMVKKKGFAYCLVTRNRDDDFAGYVSSAKLLSYPGHDPVSYYVEKMVWVADTLEVGTVMGFMLREGHSMVCVMDEYGSLAGVATLASCLDRVFQTRPAPDGDKAARQMVCKVEGLTEFAAVREWLPDVLLRTKEARSLRTVNGLLTSYLGRIPQAGEVLAIGNYYFYIIKASDTMIEHILIRKKA